MDDVTIRPARPADRAALGRYGGALMRVHHEFDPQRFLMVDDPEGGYGHFLVSQIGEPRAVVLVAERAGEVVGYAYAALEPRDWMDLLDACGFLHDVLVDPEARGTGIGERLVRGAVARLEALGAPRVVLKSAARNVPAQRLFEKLGFRHTMIEMTREAGGAG
jgi:ribosomal protein S18 acetylase RimI-like enzyme